eukprot:NODE_241_length_13209_cov_0.424256.p10 type:complete len:118 gc:universal NODE_241_length_13209_cov_0.424256:7722-8075(+)
MIKSSELVAIERKYTRFVKQVINELNEMRNKLSKYEEPKIVKQVVIKTVEDKNIAAKLRKEIQEIKIKLQEKENENKILRQKLKKTSERYHLVTLGHISEIAFLNNSLNKLNAAIIE